MRTMDMAKHVPAALLAHPLVRDVRLVGSRATGDAGPFAVTTEARPGPNGSLPHWPPDNM